MQCTWTGTPTSVASHFEAAHPNLVSRDLTFTVPKHPLPVKKNLALIPLENAKLLFRLVAYDQKQLEFSVMNLQLDVNTPVKYVLILTAKVTDETKTIRKILHSTRANEKYESEPVNLDIRSAFLMLMTNKEAETIQLKFKFGEVQERKPLKWPSGPGPSTAVRSSKDIVPPTLMYWPNTNNKRKMVTPTKKQKLF